MSKFLDENGLSRFWSNLKSRLVGKKTTGETYTYTLNDSSVEATAGVGAEIFNYYDTSGENRNLAIGDYSHAEGLRNLVSGSHSHVEGYYCIVSGNNSHAEGNYCVASGDGSHAEGSNTYARGIYSHAEGNETIAEGRYSHTEGTNTIATSGSSHAEGQDTRAAGIAAHVEGTGTMSNSDNQHVQGKYNLQDSGKAFIIGNGTSNNERHNAFAIDWNGLIYQNNSATGVDLNNKVDKVDGKDLSTEDYTTAEKTKLAGIAEGATAVTVDSEITSNSGNPVSSFAIFNALYNLGTAITSGTDLNDLTTPGNYYSFSASTSGTLLNCPLPTNGFRLNVYYTSSTARIEQELLPNVVDSQCHEIYKRSIVSGTAGTWYKFTGEAVQVSGTNAVSNETNASETI